MNPNTDFELFTQRIYQKLVDNDVLKPTTVQHNVKLKGKSGCEHQIDVYWEYEIAGNMHRVAIECKNYDSLVPVGKVRDFQGVLSDLYNVNGIMFFQLLLEVAEQVSFFLNLDILIAHFLQGRDQPVLKSLFALCRHFA